MKENLVGRTTKIRAFQDYRTGVSKERRIHTYPSFLSKILSYTPRKKITPSYCLGI